MKEKDYRQQGVIGTIIFHAIILLILIFFGMQSMREEEEGLLVNFGDSQTGMGLVEPKESQAEKAEKSTPPPPAVSVPQKSTPVKESVNTQDFEEAAALKEEQKKKQEKLRLDNAKQKQAELEAKKIRDAEARKQKEAEEAEKKRLDELAKQKAEAQNRVKNAFGGKGTGSSTSEGETQGTGNQGYATGDPNSTNRSGSGQGTSGSGYSLTGRSLRGSFPEPARTYQEEGIVKVEISVDKNGNVIDAQFYLKGSTIQNSVNVKLAIDAAKKAKFNADPDASDIQKGIITYHFVIN